MKNLSALGVGLLLSAVSSAALAFDGNTFYVAGALGNSRMDISADYTTTQPSGANVTYEQSKSEATAFTIYGGYNIFPWLGVEGQYSTFESDKVLGNNLEVQGSAMGLFGVIQAGGDVYIKGLLGFASTAGDFTAETTGTSYSPSTGSVSYGIRVGSRVGPGAVEFMWMRYPDLKFEGDDFYNATSVGNVAPLGANLGGINVKSRISTEVLSVGYSYTF
jgi:hypothetical protein